MLHYSLFNISFLDNFFIPNCKKKQQLQNQKLCLKQAEKINQISNFMHFQ